MNRRGSVAFVLGIALALGWVTGASLSAGLPVQWTQAQAADWMRGTFDGTTLQGDAVSLTQLRLGEWGRVADTTRCGDEADKLRAMGLRPDARVRVCRCGSPCIVEVQWCDGPSCRLGLSRRLAEQVMVGRASA